MHVSACAGLGGYNNGVLTYFGAVGLCEVVLERDAMAIM